MSPTTSQLRTILRYALFTLSAVCVWQALAPLARRPAEASPQPTSVVRELITKPIETLRPGMRVLAGNPEVDLLSLAQFQIVEADWRLVTYLMPKPDESTLTVEMLQEFVELEGRPVGSQTPLSFPELGIEGNATIQAITPCPTIEPAEFAEQRVITATFHHSAANVIDLQVASEKEPIGTTSNHPFWSEDRLTWVQAGELKPEERLRLVDGTLTQVTRIIPHTGPPVAVYNLTVEGTHTYHVGTSGVLVHNTKNYSLPSIKKMTVDMDHIASGHMLGGRRVSSLKSLFPRWMSSGQVESTVKAAYRNAKVMQTQGDRLRVVGSSGGHTIEMWINRATNTIETAYPL